MESRELLETLICVLCIISLVQIQVQVSFSLNQGYIQYLSTRKILPLIEFYSIERKFLLIFHRDLNP